MTLDEAFERYSDNDLMYRKEWTRNIYPEPISCLKRIYIWARVATFMGFYIPKNIINDAKADDWEIVKE